MTEEKRDLATRGRWQDTFTLDESKDTPSGSHRPTVGALTFGIFMFLRKIDGYHDDPRERLAPAEASDRGHPRSALRAASRR